MALTPPTRIQFEARFPEANYPQFDTATLDAFYVPSSVIYSCYFNKPFDVDACDDESIFLIIAHLITLEQKSTTSSGSIKDVASKSVEGVSISYVGTGSTSETELFFNSTTFGQRFLQINRFNHGGMFV